jgi:catechol 2,3-dioxygenase-like lactoylglutathione lyase family enzyme
MIMTKSLSHVAVVVKDLEKSYQWYHDTLGFEKEGEPITVDDRGADDLNAIPYGKGVHKALLMKCGDEEKTHFDLLCFEDSTGGSAIPSNHPGLTHVGFWVDDAQETYDALIAKGVECTCPPISYTMEPYGAIKVFRFYDPDKTMIEIYGK